MFGRILAWLSLRFPEKVVVTLAEYKELREEMAQYNVHSQMLQELHTRLAKAEKVVEELGRASGFVSSGKGPTRLER